MVRGDYAREYRFEESTGEDWWYLARLLRGGATSRFVATGGATYRVHPDSRVLSGKYAHEDGLLPIIDWVHSPATDSDVVTEFENGLSPASKTRAYAQLTNKLVWAVLTRDRRRVKELLDRHPLAELRPDMPVGWFKSATAMSALRVFAMPAGSLRTLPIETRSEIATLVEDAGLTSEFPDLAQAVADLFDVKLGESPPKEGFFGMARRNNRQYGPSRGAHARGSRTSLWARRAHVWARGRWLRGDNHPIALLGRLGIWTLRRIREHKVSTVVYVALLAGLTAIGFISKIEPYGYLAWVLAGGLVLSGMAVLLIGFSNFLVAEARTQSKVRHKATNERFVRAERRLKAFGKSQDSLEAGVNNLADGLKARIDELSARLRMDQLASRSASPRPQSARIHLRQESTILPTGSRHASMNCRSRLRMDQLASRSASPRPPSARIHLRQESTILSLRPTRSLPLPPIFQKLSTCSRHASMNCRSTLRMDQLASKSASPQPQSARIHWRQESTILPTGSRHASMNCRPRLRMDQLASKSASPQPPSARIHSRQESTILPTGSGHASTNCRPRLRSDQLASRSASPRSPSGTWRPRSSQCCANCTICGSQQQRTASVGPMSAPNTATLF